MPILSTGNMNLCQFICAAVLAAIRDITKNSCSPITINDVAVFGICITNR